ncbi:MAG: exodeoxyribonuclease VII large subunit [Campylobacterota bacterium]|nr:exodeoxyribonuclease VII large subunit [Campylobacterota bacterium]
MNSPIAVSTLNEQIKSVLETTFSSVYVEGEISNLTYHNSGHIYFNIKDNRSTISCVMFKGNAQYLKFRLEVGQKITISGNITVYAPRGNYQLLCQRVEPSGVGALALAYEQLKTKLQIKGYFDKTVKKTLPRFPNNIYVITSNTGAAIEDMKKILSNRYPLAKMLLLPTIVQGENAKFEIVQNLKIANIYALNDLKQNVQSIIILGRGGGSIEDLWAFNEEIVADAIFESTTPIVSAVGHENDFVISDFVADVRASTPSNAIEISTPNINDLRQYCDNISDDFNNRFKNIIFNKEQQVVNLFKSFSQHSLEKRFEFIQQKIIQNKQQFKNIFHQILDLKQNKIKSLKFNYELNLPSKKDKKGFVQISKEKQIIDLDILNNNDIITLENSIYSVDCKVISKIKI